MADEHVVYGAAGSGSVMVEAALTLLDLPYHVHESSILSGEGDAELFAAAQGMAHLADVRFIALGQLLNELVGVGDLGRLDDLGQIIAGIAAADVVRDGVVEHQIMLQDDGGLGAQRLFRARHGHIDETIHEKLRLTQA